MGSKIPGLYIHIPFCLSKCAYCDFYSIADGSQVEGYLHALSREMTPEERADFLQDMFKASSWTAKR